MLTAVFLALAATDAPITQVTVFTDQARVTRVGSTSLSGNAVFEFPPLPDLADVSSIRVEASGAEVRRVDIERVEPEKLRTSDAKAVIADLEKLDLEVSRLNEERSITAAQRDSLQRLAPQAPANEPLKPPTKLNASGWLASAAFVADQLGRVQGKLRESEAQLNKLYEKRALLVDTVQKLGHPLTRAGWKVVAHLNGSGQATLTLTYLVRNARWTPTWDLQLQPDSNTVNVGLAAQVAQDTTEDWQGVALTLSTAIPSVATQLPKLASWKIGVADRFVPTPTPMFEQVSPPPPPPPVQTARTEEGLIREQLARFDRGEDEKPQGKEKAAKLDFDDSRLRQQTFAKKVAPPPPPPPPPAAAALAPASSAPIEEAEYDAVTITASTGGARRSEPTIARTSFSLSPPAGWRAPTFGPDSPVTLANGADLAFPALQKESVPSAGGTRRIALWSASWPVTVERKLYPALTPNAFLVAELKNPSSQVLPGGPAQLFVGADPAGTARLKLVSPGEAFTLPLGIDRALKPVRNVQLVEATQGLISKDEVGTYTVTIELANPYRAPIAIRVYDQFPVSDLKDVEAKLLDSKPTATQDAKKGSLEWRLSVPPNQKTVISFTYSIKRPRGWKLQQSEVTP